MRQATNIEEGSPPLERNDSRADAEADLRAYHARKRTVCVSSLLVISPVAVWAATRAPVLGIDLFLGVACGIAYALLVMRANERLVDRQTSLGSRARGSVLRIFAFGAMPTLTAAIGPVWGMGLYFAGFFTPLALYAVAVHRDINQPEFQEKS